MITYDEAHKRVANGEPVFMVTAKGTTTEYFSEEQYDRAEKYAEQKGVRVLNAETGEYA